MACGQYARMPNRIPTYRHPALGPAQARAEYRPSASKRHYDRHWQKKRLAQLQREPLCRRCKAASRITPAKHVDHIIPLEKGGADDPSNYQSLCHSCHSVKTRTEDYPR